MSLPAVGPAVLQSGARDRALPVCPSLARRAVVAALIGIASALLCYLFVRRPGFYADFIYPWAAARSLLAGDNPYHALRGGLPNPFQAPLFYPLPAVLLVAPLAGLSLAAAGAVFFGASAGLLALAVTRGGWERLPLFVSGPFVVAASLGQWSPLVIAAALLPGLDWLGVVKPNLWLALLAYRPRWRGVVCALVLVGASIVLLPGWPLDWLRSIAFDRARAMHPAPLLLGAGPLLLLAALRWRTAEGRLLLAMAVMPQKLFFYDQLPLALLARSFRESLAFAAVTGVSSIVWALTTTDLDRERIAIPYVLATVYLPALLLVLRRPPGAESATRLEGARGAARPIALRARAAAGRGMRPWTSGHRGSRPAPPIPRTTHRR